MPSTISGSISSNVTLGTVTYTSPLTIASTGTVNVGSGIAIFGANTQAWTVDNQGVVQSGSGGIGIDLADGGVVTNGALGTPVVYGTITGGTGPAASPGGAGIALGASGSVINYAGLIAGGGGGAGGVGGGPSGAAGGAGISASSTAYVTNSNYGTITGGNGGNSTLYTGGTGASGIVFSGGTVLNEGLIAGGSGGSGGSIYSGGAGAAGVLDLAGGTIDSGGQIQGGTGGSGSSSAGGGGAGVVMEGSGSVIVHTGGGIFGGAGGGAPGTGGGGGAGIILTAGGTVTSYGSIAGGTGGSGGGAGGGGDGVTISAGGTVYNHGDVTGGNGGSNGGAGGSGVNLGGGGLVENFANVTGGNGGSSSLFPGGNGGAGVSLGGGGLVENYGMITGGHGGSGFFYNGFTQNTYSAFGGAGVILSAVGTVENLGTIAGGAGAYTGQDGNGIVLSQGGVVKNGDTAHGAVYIGGFRGIAISGGAGTVENYGTIAGGTGGKSNAPTSDDGAGGDGITLTSGGTVDNHGTITGGDGASGGSDYGGTGGAGVGLAGGLVENYGVIAGGAGGSSSYFAFGGAGVTLSAAGTVNNFGTISGGAGVMGSAFINGHDGDGIDLGPGGVVMNSSAGVIEGYFGIYSGTFPGGGTVIDYGTISGRYFAIAFVGGTDANLLELGAGYKLSGGVYGSASANDTLELLGKSGAPLTVDYNGLGLQNFQDVLFGGGGNDTLKVSNVGGTLPVTISGWTQPGEIVDLTQVGTDGTISNFDTVSHSITITGSSGYEILQLDTSDGPGFLTKSDGAFGTDVYIACFRRGTLISTPSGEVAVEDLALDNAVTTLAGARPIRWIGRRAYRGRFIAGNRQILPIRIQAGALADGIPARDLWVSPGHALYLDGVLVAAEHLLNGATIAQAQSVEEVEYFHIELDEHQILIADGAPSESYVDCDNRLQFANAPDYPRLYPDDDRPRFAYCAPRLEWDCAELIPIRAALWERAPGLGHEVTTDPGLHLVVDGRTVWPEATAENLYCFEVPAGATAVALGSRTTVPAQIVAESCDLRQLGTPIERLRLHSPELSIEIAHCYPGLCEGFHADEATHRWTDGMGHLPEPLLRAFPGAFKLEVCLLPSELGYRLPLSSGRRRTARSRRATDAGVRRRVTASRPASGARRLKSR